MDGEGQRLTVVVVLRRVDRCGPWASLLPQVLILLADPVQLALQLLDAAPLCLQQLGLALDDVVELQQVLHSAVGALRAGLHDGSPDPSGAGRRHGEDPVGPRSTPPTSPEEWGEGGTRHALMKVFFVVQVFKNKPQRLKGLHSVNVYIISLKGGKIALSVFCGHQRKEKSPDLREKAGVML